MARPVKLGVQLRRLYQLKRFGHTPGLHVTQTLLKALDNPQKQFRSVHITGTTGKGSTASFLAHVLRAGGYRVGLFTSPHLIRFNERIQVNGRPIPDRALSKLINEVQVVAKQEKLQPMFFEFATALAFRYFAEQQIDIAVVEVGMGGLSDPTNVLTPLVSVITNIGLDHTRWLGATRLAIARNKAGITKPGVPVVTAERDPVILACFRHICAQRRAPLVLVQKTIVPQAVRASLSDQTFNVRGRYRGRLRIPLLGTHQVTNACTALATLATLRRRGMPVPWSAIQRGLGSTRWPGRLEILSHRPLTIVDGAHNEDSFRALAAFLDHLPDVGMRSPHPKVLVVGLKRDKNASVLLDRIVPAFDHVIVTEGNYQPQSAARLGRAIRRAYPRVDVHVRPDVGRALRAARRLASGRGVVLITGSLYLVGDVLTLIKQNGHRRH